MEVASIIELSRALQGKAATIIGVDGYLGAGKTTVANTLSRQNGYRCVHLDEYLDPQKGGFVDNLYLTALKAATDERPLITRKGSGLARTHRSNKTLNRSALEHVGFFKLASVPGPLSFALGRPVGKAITGLVS